MCTLGCESPNDSGEQLHQRGHQHGGSKGFVGRVVEADGHPAADGGRHHGGGGRRHELRLQLLGFLGHQTGAQRGGVDPERGHHACPISALQHGKGLEACEEVPEDHHLTPFAGSC